MADVSKLEIGEGVYDIKDTVARQAVANVANKDLSNLTAAGKNICNWSNNVTNCITNIPQDISVAASAGHLLLAGGSKVYYPNGSGVFDSYTLPSNADSGDISGITTDYLFFLSPTHTISGSQRVNCYSGTTAPTGANGVVWYDTTNNVIKRHNGTSWVSGYSLPFCVYGQGLVEKQVFNGFGYIGSHNFRLPGLAGLAPNGKNADGTLKNTKWTQATVRVDQAANATGSFVIIGGNTALRNQNIITYFEQPTQPTVTAQYNAWYDTENNYIYYTNDTGATWIKQAVTVLGTEQVTSGKVDSWDTKDVFRAVDYSELPEIMVGATASKAGQTGLVPAPASGDHNKVLKGDGTWGEASTYHPDLFAAQWSDHLINDMQWLRADTFSWQSGTTYSQAYQHLVSDISGKSVRTETIAGTTIRYYLADDGHKICPANQESALNTLYNNTGIAWYYLLDSTNTRFKLPRTKFGFTGLRDSAGKYVTPTLPNITGSFSVTRDPAHNGNMGNFRNLSGAFNATDTYTDGAYSTFATDSNSPGGNKRLLFNASASSPIYANGATVQQAATQMYLYFYVGSFTQSAITNTAGLNASLFNGKADTNLLNVANNVDFVVETQLPTGNENKWYRKYKSGWVEQGGRYTVTSSSPHTINLPVTMADTKYFVSATVGLSSAGDTTVEIHVRTDLLTTSSIAIQKQWTSSSGYYYWEVRGKAA